VIPSETPWLPCSHCGWTLVNCTCVGVDEAVWEVLLEKSRNARLSERHAAEYARNREKWAA
jgi:hypothetical protein